MNGKIQKYCVIGLISLIFILLIYKTFPITELFEESLQIQLNHQVEQNHIQPNREVSKNKSKQRYRMYIDYKQKIYTELLALTKEALDELKIPFFLSSGTCLGYFRENKFINHDYDIDIGIFAKDYTPKLIDKMTDKGFKLYRVLGNQEDGMELSFRKEKGHRLGRYAKVDIFLHYPENGYISWYTYKYPEFKEKIQYRVSKFKLTSINFMGLQVNVPEPTLGYILEHYGEDWTIPKKAGINYFYATSPKSIVKQ